MVATRFYNCDETESLQGAVRRSRDASDPRDLVGRVSALLHRARVGRVLVLTAGAISPEHNLLDVVFCVDLVLPEREQS